jgi:hypothetical protein
MSAPGRFRIPLYPRTRRQFAALALRVGALLGLLGFAGCLMTSMPSRSFRGVLPPADATVTAASQRLRADVKVLASDIGERNTMHPAALERAAKHVEASFVAAGYAPARETFRAVGEVVANVVVERRGTSRPDEIVLVGAHYDSAPGTPGADDNASGTAVLLELARVFSARASGRTIRFVAFVNEEPPFFQTEEMGSLVHARAARARGDRIVAMLALETMGFYRDEAGSQHYPGPIALAYPSRGDFIAFVSDLGSRSLTRDVVRAFRAHASFPSEGAALPGILPGVDWSDHWSFSKVGYPAVMVTDTAPFRLPHYHQPSDRADVIDYERLARVERGLVDVVDELAR